MIYYRIILYTIFIKCYLFLTILPLSYAGNVTVLSSTGIQNKEGLGLSRNCIVKIYKIVNDKDDFPIVDDILINESIIGYGIPFFMPADGKFSSSPQNISKGDKIWVRVFDSELLHTSKYFGDSDVFECPGTENDEFDVYTFKTLKKIIINGDFTDNNKVDINDVLYLLKYISDCKQ